MKKLLTALCVIASFSISYAQQTQSLPSFNAIISSPKIELELIKGTEESITWEAYGVDPEKVNIEVKRNRLKIYLDDARVAVKYHKKGYKHRYHPVYGKDVIVKATVTYVNLDKLQIRGEEQVAIKGPIESNQRFVLKAYGASAIELSDLRSEKVKLVLIGENELKVASGQVDRQKIKSIGENIIDLRDVQSLNTKTSTIGESKIYINTSERVRVNAIGESAMRVKGSPRVTKGLVIGENRINEY